jgi:hypothetical protein
MASPAAKLRGPPTRPSSAASHGRDAHQASEDSNVAPSSSQSATIHAGASQGAASQPDAKR